MTPSDVEKGAALYDDTTLRYYDVVVHGISNHLAWRCSTKRLRALYDEHVSDRHLDVGVGSGYFLDHSRKLGTSARLSLLDLNPQALRYAFRRIARYRPTLHVGSVLERLQIPEAPFDSIAAMYLLHCVPGDLKAKAVALGNLGACLSDRGVLFGATILGEGVPRNPVARVLMNLYNSRQIFGNAGDRREDLEEALAARFRRYHVEVEGMVAIFVARDFRE